jgi:hypothetical protein
MIVPVNNELLNTKVAQTLVAGDEVTFGSVVYQIQQTFHPATIVKIDFRVASVLASI